MTQSEFAVYGEPDWYKDAIIYELHVRTFFDSNQDGIGDFAGLTQKLDYLADLGVTALWLLPFYPSPLRDDGYDIADYMSVNPDYGTLRDFKRFLRRAHELGLKVITELVINHTSDRHPWFQRARLAAAGSRHRNYYVWSDDPAKYSEARVIFQDFERSNWTYDEDAGAYYWHRFYSHQPDLNFDNPAVRREVFRVLDFWMDMGVDGFRLDAIPYLYEREGTNCENLPETHQFLKSLRAHIDQKYHHGVFLAEANQWPEDAAQYFGDGDECHLAFHFPLMPRMFMALYMEDRYPIIDILEHTPAIPEGCQWATFLRNHDELTLEMVTDEERDYMYKVYGNDPQFRINVGIRRRLAPLLGNNRRRLELIHALLLTLPGTPVLYYGNEIGMGDNVYLGDRDGVRTPFQWSPDRNAGFSRANPQQLCLPVIVDPEFHYESVNVEAQQNNPSSFLWWMRRMIALRKSSTAFGRGSVRFLTADNPKVLTFLREFGEERILVLANLSRFVQATTLDTGEYVGSTLTELFSQNEFPPISSDASVFALGPHDFYLFRLHARQPAEKLALASDVRLPATIERQRMDKVLEEFAPFIGSYLRKQRWFAGKSLKITRTSQDAYIALWEDGGLWIVRVQYVGHPEEHYLLPVMFGDGDPEQAIGYVNDGVTRISVIDGTQHEEFWRRLAEHWIFADRVSAKQIERMLSSGWRGRAKSLGSPWIPRLPRSDQSNTSVIFGEELIFKLFRRLESGVNPDWEIGQFLTEHKGAEIAPPTWMGLEYRHNAQTYQIGTLQEFVRNQGDGWTYTLDHLSRFFDSAAAHAAPLTPPHCANWWGQCPLPADDVLLAMMGEYIGQAGLIGVKTAQMHMLLASDQTPSDFAREPFSSLDQRATYQSMRQNADQSLAHLKSALPNLSPGAATLAEVVLAQASQIGELLHRAPVRRVQGVKIRCHGDYHLGQLLYTGEDFRVVDFEGEPLLPLSRRRIKRSPLKDVAGMIRSFHYAAFTQAVRHEEFGVPLDILRPWAATWYYVATARFLETYRATMNPRLLPEPGSEWLSAYLLEKALYELQYELRHRPQWAVIPLEGILNLIHHG